MNGPVPSVTSLPGRPDDTWLVGPPFVAGRFSSRAALALPIDEFALDAWRGSVVSVHPEAPWGFGPVPVTLFVRAIDTAAIALSLAGRYVWSAVTAADSLYFASLPAGAGSGAGDVLAADYATGSVTTVAPLGGQQATWWRSPLAASPSRNTVVSLVGHKDATFLEVIRPGQAVRRYEVPIGRVVALSDTAAFIDMQSGRQLTAIDLASGAVLWTLSEILASDAYVTSDGSVLVVATGYGLRAPDGPPTVSQSVAEPGLLLVETATGASRALAHWPLGAGRAMWVDASNDHVVALLPDAHSACQLLNLGQGLGQVGLVDLDSLPPAGLPTPATATVQVGWPVEPVAQP